MKFECQHPEEMDMCSRCTPPDEATGDTPLNQINCRNGWKWAWEHEHDCRQENGCTNLDFDDQSEFDRDGMLNEVVLPENEE